MNENLKNLEEVVSDNQIEDVSAEEIINEIKKSDNFITVQKVTDGLKKVTVKSIARSYKKKYLQDDGTLKERSFIETKVVDNEGNEYTLRLGQYNIKTMVEAFGSDTVDWLNKKLRLAITKFGANKFVSVEED